MKDYLVLAALVASFATFVTAHLFLTWRLLWYARPRWRGLVVVVLPPLAPIWGFTMGYRRLSTIWLGSVVCYLLARLVVL